MLCVAPVTVPNPHHHGRIRMRSGRYISLLCLAFAGLPQFAGAQSAPRQQPVFIGGYLMPQWQASAEQACSRIFHDGFDRGTLSQPGGNGQPIEYRTLGGYSIKIDKHTITITDIQGLNAVQYWGDPHENLNGKHVKDWGGRPGWSGNRRSIILGDSTKVTMEAIGPTGVVEATSIYDQQHSVHVINADNVISHYGSDPAETYLLDLVQYDGETGLFVTDPVTQQASYGNLYNESFDAQGNPVVIAATVPIGTTGGCANPNLVFDLFP